jgi:hypothetical protein
MAASIAFMMGLYPVEILYCASFAALPDQLEVLGGLRIFAHRTWTHEVLVWLAPLLVLLACPLVLPGIPRVLVPPLEGGLQEFLTIRTWVLFLPGLLHLAGDVLTPQGIRVATRKVALGLFRTGSTMEYVATGVLAATAAFFYGIR